MLTSFISEGLVEVITVAGGNILGILSHIHGLCKAKNQRACFKFAINVATDVEYWIPARSHGFQQPNSRLPPTVVVRCCVGIVGKFALPGA